MPKEFAYLDRWSRDLLSLMWLILDLRVNLITSYLFQSLSFYTVSFRFINANIAHSVPYVFVAINVFAILKHQQSILTNRVEDESNAASDAIRGRRDLQESGHPLSKSSTRSFQVTAIHLQMSSKTKSTSANSIISTTQSILSQVTITMRDAYFRFRSMYIVIFKRSTLLASTSSKPKYISEHLLLRGFLWEPSMYSEKALDSFASLHSYRTKTHVPLAARSTLLQHCSKDSTNKLWQSLTLFLEDF